MRRGYYPKRSGDIEWVTKPPDYLGSGYPHAGPWDYLEKVPLLFYGPGDIRPGVYKQDVTFADIAPTLADLAGYSFRTSDGSPLTQALLDPAQRAGRPRVLFTVVWDSAGRNVLDQWPDQWPNLKKLIRRGAWFENAVIGSAPTSTAQGHAILGTGAFPMHNGIIGNEERVGNRVVDPWYGGRGPSLLKTPTLADLYDRDKGNAPKVGLVATTAWYLGMVGHGSFLKGGDRDDVVLRYQGSKNWYIPRRYEDLFHFPDYVNDLPPLTAYYRYGDAADGRIDGTWRGHDIASENRGFNTPARMPYQTLAIETVMKHERFGKDDLTDLFFTNYKLIDEVGHIWTMNSLEMKDAVRVSDAELPKLISFLDRWVGRDRWVMVLTADHGAIPNPKVSGAFVGSLANLQALVAREFDSDNDGVDLIEHTKPTHMWLNIHELKQNGFTLAQVARFIQGLTKGDIANKDSNLDPADSGKAAFLAVFPTRLLPKAPCLATP